MLRLRLRLTKVVVVDEAVEVRVRAQRPPARLASRAS